MVNLVDREFVDSILDFGGGDMLEELLEIFRDTVPPRLATLQQLACSEPEATRRAAHSLRSSGSNIGAAGFAELARRIESESENDQLPAAVEELVALYGETVEAFEALSAAVT